MPIETKRDNGVNPEEISGRNFRISSIVGDKNSKEYRLSNMRLPLDWKNSKKAELIDLDKYCKDFNPRSDKPIKGQVVYDPQTKLITEVTFNFPKTQSSRVILNTRLGDPSNGFYQSENIKDLSMAIIYQQFLANYLSSMTDLGNKYPFIYYLDANYSRYYGSASLRIPEDIYRHFTRPVTDKTYQEQTLLSRAKDICSQFSTRFLRLDFNDEGFLCTSEIYGDACTYEVDSIFDVRGYIPHNVNNKFEAATHHGIVAEFINDLIERKEDQEY